MISLKRCREILGEKAKDYSDHQLEAIRTVLMRFAKTNLQIIKEIKNNEKGNDNVSG